MDPKLALKILKWGSKCLRAAPFWGSSNSLFSILRFRCSKAGAGALFGGLRAASWPTLVRFWALLEAALGKFSPIFSVLAALAGGAAPPGLPAAKTSENN